MDKKNIATNVVVNFCLQIINLAIGLVIPRMILGAFGSEVNGLVSSINQFMMYLTLVESGLAQVAIVSLYKPLVDSDTNEVNHQLSIINYFYRKTGYIFLVLLLLMALVYPIVIRNRFNYLYISFLIIVLGLQYVVDFLFIGKFKVLLVADQKMFVMSIVQIITSVVMFVCEVLLLLWGASIIAVKVVIPIIHLMQFGLIKIIANRKYKSFDFSGITKDKKLAGRGSAVLHQITGLVMSSTDITFLTLLGIDLKEISVYTVYNYITVEINSFLGTFVNSIIPSFGKALVLQKGEIKKQFSLFTGTYLYIVNCLFGPLLLLFLGFVKLYTSNVSDVNYVRPSLSILFSLCFILNSIKTPYIMLIQSSGLYKETRVATLVEAVVNIVASIPLIIIWGVNGALAGTICAHVYRYIELIRFGKKYFSIPIKDYVFSVLAFLVVDSTFAMILYNCWVIDISFNSWLKWIFVALVVTIAFFIVNSVVFYVKDKESFMYFINLFRKRIKNAFAK